MDRQDIVKERIRDSVKLSELIERLTGANLKSGKMCCPFHSESRPSFFVNDSKGVYNCFVCGGGDIFTFVMKYHGLRFGEAVKLIDREFQLGLINEPVSVRELVSNIRRNTLKEQKKKEVARLEFIYDDLCREYRIASIATEVLEVFSDLWCYYTGQKIKLERDLEECMQKIFST